MLARKLGGRALSYVVWACAICRSTDKK